VTINPADSARPPADFTIVIPTYNERHRIGLLLGVSSRRL
jgi:hypothetical protein